MNFSMRIVATGVSPPRGRMSICAEGPSAEMPGSPTFRLIRQTPLLGIGENESAIASRLENDAVCL